MSRSWTAWILRQKKWIRRQQQRANLASTHLLRPERFDTSELVRDTITTHARFHDFELEAHDLEPVPVSQRPSEFREESREVPLEISVWSIGRPIRPPTTQQIQPLG